MDMPPDGKELVHRHGRTSLVVRFYDPMAIALECQGTRGNRPLGGPPRIHCYPASGVGGGARRYCLVCRSAEPPRPIGDGTPDEGIQDNTDTARIRLVLDKQRHDRYQPPISTSAISWPKFVIPWVILRQTLRLENWIPPLCILGMGQMQPPSPHARRNSMVARHPRIQIDIHKCSCSPKHSPHTQMHDLLYSDASAALFAGANCQRPGQQRYYHGSPHVLSAVSVISPSNGTRSRCGSCTTTAGSVSPDKPPRYCCLAWTRHNRLTQKNIMLRP